jgi:hypothetical protein
MYNLAHSLEGQHRNPVFAYLPCKLPEAVQGGVLSINSMSVEQTSSVCSGRPRPSYRVATALPAAVDMAVGSSVFRFGSAVSRRRPALDALNAKPKSPESKSSCAGLARQPMAEQTGGSACQAPMGSDRRSVLAGCYRVRF